MGRAWVFGLLGGCAVVTLLLIQVYIPLHESDASEENSKLSSDDTHEESRSKRQSGDECGSEVYQSCASTLPLESGTDNIDFRKMPTLSNGHIGFQPYGDTVFMNGLYNGNDDTSHRARIPALIMSQIKMSSDEEERQTIRKYSFDAKHGTFTEEIECTFAYITHVMYPHQKYNKILVSDIYAERKPEIPGGGVIHMTYPLEESTEDIQFNEKHAYYANWRAEGRTLQAEAGEQTKSLNVFWMHPLREISIRETTINETMVMAMDRSAAAARGEFDIALDMLYDAPGGAHRFLQEHIAAWQKTWWRGGIEVEGDNLVSKVTAFAQYNLISNFPAQFPYQQPQKDEHLFGVARGSMARGAKNLDHQGHVMWDSELYVLPAVLPFHPDLAKEILRYRSALAYAAQQNAEQSGDQGYRFPWESAYSGHDATPPGTCDGCAERQIHVGGAVAWAIRQYYSLTRDRDYHTNPDYNGCDMTREIARFYAERAVYNTSEGRYDIDDVMGPDDYHDHVMNNAYTQVTASLAIHWARYMACMCGRNEREEVPDEWLQKALYLKLPFDNVKRVHYQHEGYQYSNNRTVKQADTILLAYPLNWNMSRDIMKNDLEFYENEIEQNSPAMTYSFMTVGWKFVEDYSQMTSYFMKSYQDYLVQPFKVWTEYPIGVSSSSEESTVNFLPGMGAFLQSLVYGFAGVRIRPEHVEFHNPMPPPGSTKLTLRGFHYLGGNFTFTIQTGGQVRIQVNSMTGEFELVLLRNSTSNPTEESLKTGDDITLENGSDGFYIYSIDGTPCEHPRDYIYMPWGYSPWVDSATNVELNALILAFALTISYMLHFT